ncbi:MAG: (Fe-S)-binding protein, partial [Allomuricauda sp.]
SNVDVAALKAEFLYQYQESNGYSFRSKLFAYNTKLTAMGSNFPGLTNTIYNSKILGGLLKSVTGVAKERSFPPVHKVNFNGHLDRFRKAQDKAGKKVVLYLDEFTKYLDVEVGQDAIELLCKLGYDVKLHYAESGRTYLSKGFLKQAKKLAAKNLEKLEPIIGEKTPIIGLEPSAILSFRDEYKRLSPRKELLEKLASHSFLIEEFLASEIEKGLITAASFTQEKKKVKIHSHCHQKALSNQKVTFDILNLPKNYEVTIIPSGCCGMAGSFGYEKEHYKTSMQVGELKLFPAVRKSEKETLIAANGTSCRHQIKDGTDRDAEHPVSILRKALII